MKRSLLFVLFIMVAVTTVVYYLNIKGNMDATQLQSSMSSLHGIREERISASNERTNNLSITGERIVPQPDTTSAREDEKRFVHIAYEQVSKVMEINDPTNVKVEHTNDIVVITFLLPRAVQTDRPPFPGADYIARVKINKKTGEIIQILVGS